jgi:hypothetical protein
MTSYVFQVVLGLLGMHPYMRVNSPGFSADKEGLFSDISKKQLRNSKL